MRVENKSSNIITTLLPQTHIMNGDVFLYQLRKNWAITLPVSLKKSRKRE
jgi:hypothetical protein